MSIEVINTGVYPNDGLGDPLRTAYTKINHNFTQFSPVAFTGQYNSLYGIPSFARVAYTGQYTDLLGTPVLGLLAFLNTINNSNWFGIPLAINHGGTGQVTASAAFDALSPMTNWGDMIFGKQYGANYRLPIGANGQILVVSNGQPSWINPTIPVINEITNITNQLPAVVLPGEGAYVHYGVASGTNVLSTIVYPAITAYTDGIFVELLCSNYNTGNVTFNNHGMGPLPVRWPDGNELVANTLIPGGIVYLTCVGGVFQLVAGGNITVSETPIVAVEIATLHLSGTLVLANHIMTVINMQGTMPFGTLNNGVITFTEAGIYSFDATLESMGENNVICSWATGIGINLNNTNITASDEIQYQYPPGYPEGDYVSASTTANVNIGDQIEVFCWMGDQPLAGGNPFNFLHIISATLVVTKLG